MCIKLNHIAKIGIILFSTRKYRKYFFGFVFSPACKTKQKRTAPPGSAPRKQKKQTFGVYPHGLNQCRKGFLQIYYSLCYICSRPADIAAARRGITIHTGIGFCPNLCPPKGIPGKNNAKVGTKIRFSKPFQAFLLKNLIKTRNKEKNTIRPSFFPDLCHDSAQQHGYLCGVNPKRYENNITWKSHATLTLLAKQECPLWLQYD